MDVVENALKWGFNPPKGVATKDRNGRDLGWIQQLRHSSQIIYKL